MNQPRPSRRGMVLPRVTRSRVRWFVPVVAVVLMVSGAVLLMMQRQTNLFEHMQEQHISSVQQLATPAADTDTSTSEQHECKDFSEICAVWAADEQCTVNPDRMMMQCKRSCGWCLTLAPQPAVEVEGGYTHCGDDVPECHGWARDGQCTSNPRWMLVHCRQACGLCDARSAKTVAPTAAPTSFTEPPVHNHFEQSDCQDKEAACEHWAAGGQCGMPHVKLNCKRSCGGCLTAATLAPTPSDCEDQHPACSVWAKAGECKANPRYMELHCRSVMWLPHGC